MERTATVATTSGGRAEVPALGAPALCVELAHLIDTFCARMRTETEGLVEVRLQGARHAAPEARAQAAREVAELTRRARALGHAVDVVLNDLGRLYEAALRATDTVEVSAAHERRHGW